MHSPNVFYIVKRILIEQYKVGNFADLYSPCIPLRIEECSRVNSSRSQRGERCQSGAG